MSGFLWGVYPYLCVGLFLVIPLIRMAYRPFSWSTRASGLFNRRTMGLASLLLHWGLVLVLAGHLAGLFGGLLGSESAVAFFYWTGLVGGVGVLVGSVLALYRRVAVPEVRAMSQPDDYLVHLFLIPIVSLALYQVIVERIFGIAYTAAPWVASLWALSPQPELMASAGVITQLHVFFALTFFAYFPFTKLVHAWTYPINYFVRPYQAMRTARYKLQRRWELGLRSDKSWLLYGLAGTVLVFVAAAVLFGRTSTASAAGQSVAAVNPGDVIPAELMGRALYLSQCARCHGVDGRGDGPGAASPTFAAPPRDLTAGKYHFVSTTNGVASDGDLRRTIRKGLPLAGMPGFHQLSDSQLNSLVTVLADLWENRAVPGTTIPVPDRPPATAATVETGARLYNEYCVTCHGGQGRGDGVLAGSLPSRPADLSAGAFKAGSGPEQLYLRVAAGVLPAGMPAFGAALSPDEIWAVVAHLERMKRP